MDKYKCNFWKTIDKNKIQCQLCPRNCMLSEGQRGFCFVRQNISNQLILTTYGRSSGFCIDPIEKKPLYQFHPGSSTLSFGTAGCNLGCKFCQNWDISKSEEFDRLLDQATPEMIAKCAKKMNCKSVAFTYNDPVIFTEFAIDIANECHKLNIKTVAVTAGYISDEARPKFFEVMDAANVDLKAFTDNFYKEYTSGNLQPVLDTLVYLRNETKVWFEITTLLIPGLNDSEEELHNMTEWIVSELGTDIPIHFTAFHPDYQMINLPQTPPKTLLTARKIALSKGIKYVYVGNIYDQEGSNTYCHSCGQLLIKRDWHQIIEYNIVNSTRCIKCNELCAGYFDEEFDSSETQIRRPIKLSSFS